MRHRKTNWERSSAVHCIWKIPHQFLDLATRLHRQVFLCYQLALQSQPVDFYLHSLNREGFLAANKEGLASIIGSTCLFLITTAVCRRFVYKVKWVYAK